MQFFLNAPSSQHTLGHIALWSFLSALPLCIPIRWGPFWTYPLSMLGIIFIVQFLKRTGFNRWYLALLLWIPIVGLTSWQRSILLMDLGYLIPKEGLLHMFKLLWQCHQNGWVLLVMAGIGCWTIEKSMAKLFLLCALFTGSVEWTWTQILLSVHHKQWTLLNMSAWWVEISRVIILLFAYIYRPRSIPYRYAGWSLLSILVTWTHAPFLWFLLSSQPVATPTLGVPMGQIHLGSLLKPATIPNTSDNFADALNEQGTEQLPQMNWWCETERARIVSKNNAFALLELRKEDTVENLRPYLNELFIRGIREIGFITTVSPNQLPRLLFPPLQKHLQYPVLHWQIGPPPNTLPLEDEANRHFDRLSDEIYVNVKKDYCSAQVSWQTSINDLSILHQHLQSAHQCPSSIYLQMASKRSIPTQQWESPLPCKEPPK